MVSTNKPECFVVATGQYDNIGDALLRRRMLDRIQREALMHVHVGSASKSYIDALGIEPGHRVYTSFQVWLLECLRAVTYRQASMLLPVGELSANSRGTARHLLIAAPAVIGRLKRQSVLRIGSAIGTPEGPLWPILRMIARLPTDTVWRDTVSPEFMGLGSAGPDWAFDADWTDQASSAVPASRDRLAISMRFDRPFPSSDWSCAIREIASERALSIAVVTQVKKDNERSALLASQLGGELFPWVNESHLVQEERVREVYRSSQMVVSDRLHGLILGLVEGAVPVGLINGPDQKIGRHFEAAGIERVSLDVRGCDGEQIAVFLREVLAREREIMAAAHQAAQRVKAYDQMLIDGLTR